MIILDGTTDMICSQTHLNGRPGQHVVLVVVELGQIPCPAPLSSRPGPGPASEIIRIAGLSEGDHVIVIYI